MNYISFLTIINYISVISYFIFLGRMTYTDIKSKEIENIFILLSIIAAIIAAIISNFNSFDSSNFNSSGFSSLLIFMGGALLIRFLVEFFMKKEAMGEGDIYIIGTMGCILGIPLGINAIFLSAIIALIFFIITMKRIEMPFVPFLTVATLIEYIFKFNILDIKN